MARRYITPEYNRKPKKKRPRVHSKNRHTNNKNGKVILVRLIAISNFSVSSLKPGAINATNNGIKISIIKTIASKDKKRILKNI